MNIEQIRQDFPILQGEDAPLYFDNACTTLRPRQVIDAIREYYEKYPVCAGRAVYDLGIELTEKCEEVRRQIANFIGAQLKEEIIFTKNTTESINLVARGLDLNNGDIVITTDKEHNSNFIPWQNLAKAGEISHKIVPVRSDGTFNLDAFEEVLKNNKVKLVSLTCVSNLDGTSIPTQEIIKLAHKYGALTLLDTAQSAGHTEINVSKLDVDFLAFSGHKMLGPSGTGVLYGKAHLLKSLSPLLLGGGAIEGGTLENFTLLSSPEKFEAGLQNYSGILGLGEAIKYLKQVGFEFIKKQEFELNNFITQNIKNIPGIKILGPIDAELRAGIISFYFDDPEITGHQIAAYLNKLNNICIRSGKHCVHSWFYKMNIRGSIRASFYFYNTLEEAKIFINALQNLDIQEVKKENIGISC